MEPNTRHGKVESYNQGCRCDDCRAAGAAANRAKWDRRQGRSTCRSPARYRTDVDPIVVERIMAGQRPRDWIAGEMRAAIQQLAEHGLSTGEIASRIGIHPDTVKRYRRLIRRRYPQESPTAGVVKRGRETSGVNKVVA